MTYTQRLTALFLAPAIALLAACGGKVLDFRNAEISNGKIYGGGANAPFSGKVTNLPMSKLPLGPLGVIARTLSAVSEDKSYSEFFFASGFAGMMGGNAGGALCDLKVDEGVPHGVVSCAVQGSPVLKVEFKQGSLQGDAQILDPRRTGKVAAEFSFSDGKLDGKSTVYDTESGKALHKVKWDEGVATGVEETWNKAGGLTFRATLVAGKYEGQATKYDGAGNVVIGSVYKEGVFLKNVRPGMTDLQSCVQDGLEDFRKFHGMSEPVPQERTQQWEENCKAGNRPS